MNENEIEYYFKENIFSSEKENINYLRIINNNIKIVIKQMKIIK